MAGINIISNTTGKELVNKINEQNQLFKQVVSNGGLVVRSIALMPEVFVRAEANAKITATQGAAAVTAITDDAGYTSIALTKFGKWTITNNKRSVEIEVNDVAQYDVTLAEIYGFRINKNDPNPATRVTYPVDCLNTNYQPAKMNYESGSFDYGDWGNAWFMDIKPCMLKSDGTVDYYLNPNDYTKKVNGDDSDITNTDYDGNAMIGIPTAYIKSYDDGDYAYVYISKTKLEGFEAYAHTNENGDIIPYTYMPIYNGSLIDDKLRSLSGQSLINNKNASQEMTYAQANNPVDSHMWNIEVLSDRMLINDLLILIGKSTNTQFVFGNGYNSGGSKVEDLKATGTMNDKGLFWGANNNSDGVKVFGMENYWGNQWRRLAGYIVDHGITKVKMTYGMDDGSSVMGYNLDGNGYKMLNIPVPSGTSGSYINKIQCTPYGIFPYNSSGSSSTYECDGLWINNNIISCALVGGVCYSGLLVGAFCSDLSASAWAAGWNIGASVSCKPKL